MLKIEQKIFPSWPYDCAMQWMRQSHEQVAKDSSKIFIGCGSHKEVVVTLGRNKNHNVIDEALIASLPNTIIRQLERGGGVTAHEPGQVVFYPVLNLAHHGLNIGGLINIMQQTMLTFLHEFGLDPKSDGGSPGVFIKGSKIGFLGMRIKDGISSHGIAINVSNNGKIFSHFNPCGVPSLPITSLKDHVDLSVSLETIMTKLCDCFIRQWRCH